MMFAVVILLTLRRRNNINLKTKIMKNNIESILTLIVLTGIEGHALPQLSIFSA
jgi:hypothetical protein